jgi:hypothetical protein
MTDDIEVARKDLERAIKWGIIGSPPSVDTMRLGLRALDALAREPGLSARVAALEFAIKVGPPPTTILATRTTPSPTERVAPEGYIYVDGKLLDAKDARIADLEARERRVREACAKARAENLRRMADAERNGHETWDLLTAAGVFDDVLAILDGKVTP